jgi:hypothetical protein
LIQQIIPQTFKTTAMSTIEKKSVKVGKYVDTDFVDAFIRNYKQERWIHNSKRLGKEDSLSCWYSVEELEEFIATIKQHGADGIRLYFGAYPNETDRTKGKDGRQSMVLVATRSKHELGGVSHKDVYLSDDGKANILAYNMANYCPPFCGPAGGIGSSIGVTILENPDGLSVI